MVIVWCLEHHTKQFRAPRNHHTVSAMIDKGWVTPTTIGIDQSYVYMIVDDAWRAIKANRASVLEAVSKTDQEFKDVWGALFHADRRARTGARI